MSAVERCKMYSDSKITIKKVLEKNSNIDENVINNQLILIKKDLVSLNESLRDAALDMLEFLMSNVNLTSFWTEVIKLVNEKNLGEEVKQTIMSHIKKSVVKAINNETFNITEYLGLWKNQDVSKLLQIIEELFKDELPKDISHSVFLTHIIPELVNTKTNNEIRNILLDIAFKLLPCISCSELTPKQSQDFTAKVISDYVKSIGELREQDYENWHKVWIFIVRFCGKTMHGSMELTNRLLRVVELAFRNQSSHQRLQGYDCWKELIDNANLRADYLSSAKQIKLLMTPLKAKFSKQEQVIMKRFEVFSYLLEKLQDKATLALVEFMEFCFGAVGEKSDPNKTGQGKTVPILLPKIIGTLLQFLGHTDSCLEIEHSFGVPLINEKNVTNFCQILMNCIKESQAILENEIFGDSREKIRVCLWRTFFSIVDKTVDSDKRNCLDIIVQSLMTFIENENHKVIKGFTSVIFSKDLKIHRYIFTRMHQQLVTIICHKHYNDLIYDHKLFQNMVSQCLLLNKTFFENILTHFNDNKLADDVNLDLNCDLWLGFANYLLLDIENEDKDKFQQFLFWPIQYFHLINEITLKEVKNYWIKIYQGIVESEKYKLNFLRELEKLFKDNPLQCSNLVKVMSLIVLFEPVFSKDFVAKILDLTLQCLILPTLKPEEQEKLASIVSVFFKPTLVFYTEDDNEEAIKKLCQCVEHIFKVHKNYELLDELISFFGGINAKLKSVFSGLLSKLLFDLFAEQSDLNNSVAKNVQKVMLLLEVNKMEVNKTDAKKPTKQKSKNITPPSGRSAKIANLLKNGINNDTSPKVLRLFGKNVDSTTPVKIKGSQLNNVTTPVRTKKIMSKAQKMPAPPPIDDESTSQFVTINTEVKFQPEKLNEHQKEILSMRREDIPALYQDLSQSQSQDFLNMKNSSSNSVDQPVDKENIANNSNVQDLNFESFKENVGVEETSATTTDESHQTVIEAKTDKPPEPEEKKDKKTKEELKRTKIEAELRRLKMDIVASDEFLNTTPRRTRAKPKDEGGKKSPKSRKSLDSVKEVKSDNRRRTIDGFVTKRRGRKKKIVQDDVNEDFVESNDHEYAMKVDCPLSPLRKRKLSDSDQEDIIESSQDTTVNITPICSPKRMTMQEIAAEKPEDVSLAETITQTETETCDSGNVTEFAEPVVQLDLPKKPELTESEVLLSHMETVSLLADEEVTMNAEELQKEEPEVVQILSTPITKRRTLPTSPISGDTPTKTDELLTDTINISPIAEEKTMIEDTEQKIVEETEQKTIIEETEQIKSSSNSSSDDDDLTVPAIEIEKPKTNGFTEKAKLWNIEVVQSPISSNRMTIYKRKTGLSMSPSASRIKKLMSPFHQTKTNLQDEFANGDEKEDILTFSKELPSPIATPKNSILKKRFSDADDGMSPNSKRKRVHFSYPTTTCKKVFFKTNCLLKDAKIPLIHQKETEEVDFLDYCHEISNETQSEHFYPDLINCADPVKNIFGKIGMTTSSLSMQKFKQLNIKTIGELAKKTELELLNLPVKMPVLTNIYKALDSYNKKEVDGFKLEFEDVNNDSTTVISIYPELNDCLDSVVKLIRKMKNLDLEIYLLKLREQNIRYIGDLVVCHEEKLLKLPFKTPVIPNIYKALDYYHKIKQNQLTTKIEFQVETPDCLYPELVECQDNIKDILKDSKHAEILQEHNITTIGDLAKINEQDLLQIPIKEPIVTTIYKTLEQHHKLKNPEKKPSLEDILQQTNIKDIKKHIKINDLISEEIQDSGVTKLLENVWETVKTTGQESQFSDFSISKCANIEFLKKRSLCELKESLNEAFELQIYKKHDLLNELVENQSDLAACLNKFNEREICEIALQTKDVNCFIKEINDRHENDVLNVVDRTKVLAECSQQELTDEIARRNNEDINRTIVEQTNQTETLEDMFKTISRKLPKSTLMKLHIEFLKSIDV